MIEVGGVSRVEGQVVDGLWYGSVGPRRALITFAPGFVPVGGKYRVEGVK